MRLLKRTRGPSRRLFAMLATASAVLVGANLAMACNVPVFRFALEHWRPDPYRAVLYHRGPLTDVEREQILPLQDQQDAAQLNFVLRMVDVSKLDESEEKAEDSARFAALKDPALPLLIVQYPAHLNIEKPVWAGSLERESISVLTDSPVRRELIQRLAAGQTAVWLFLESGQGQQDDAAVALVEAELKTLEQELKLPELTTAPEDELLTDAPLQVAFSLIRVPRDSAEEKALIAMLIGSEPDLADRSNDPMVFPVFGRGRALWALVGAGITAKNIHDSAEFLVGPCSCEVKELNPGFDLLLVTDWNEQLSLAGISVAAATAPTPAPPSEAEFVPIPLGSPPPARSAPTIQPTPAEALQNSPANISRNGNFWLIAGGILTSVLLVSIAIAVLRK